MSNALSLLNGFVDQANGATVVGWAWDPGKPNEPVVVELSRNGQPVATVSADRFRQDLLDAGFGNGCHAFEIELPLDSLDAGVPVFSATIQATGFELKRSPFRCGPPRPERDQPRPATTAVERLNAEIASFSRAWTPRLHHENRLAFLAAREGGLTEIQARPQWFMIETTSHCNLKCVICPHGHGAMENASDLDLSRFSRDFDFLASAERMQLFGTGEPLLSGGFWEILESIGPGSGVEVSINSNGTLLNQERIDRLLRSPLSWISISLDAARPETYRRVRGADFDVVISRVRDLIRARNARQAAGVSRVGSASRLEIFINMTLMRENIEEFPEFVDLAADLGADGVQVCQLLWHKGHSAWETKKGEWKFVYRDQLLRNLPDKANDFIQQGLERAATRRVPIVFDGSQFERSRPVVQGEEV